MTGDAVRLTAGSGRIAADTERLSSQTAPDLTACDRLQIHTPGHIQPHGVLLATAPGTSRISHISENLDLSIGLRAEKLLGEDLEAVLGRAAVSALEQSLHDTSYAPSNVLRLTLPFPVRPKRKVLVHRRQERLILELEEAPVYDEAGDALSRAHTIIASLRDAQTQQALCDAVVRELRTLTGYDRVMLYRFDPLGHGCVIAEDKQDALPPYLNMRYPATDIPQQARRLYLLARVRAIVDTEYQPVTLLSRDSDEIDMSLCALRGIAPVHLEYMRNMGTRASFSVSLVRDNALWGMIVCHHQTPLTPSADLRALCDVIGQLISVLLLRLETTEALAARLDRTGAILSLRNAIDLAGSVAEGLAQESRALLDLVGASGALIRCGGATKLLGSTPAAAAAVADAALRLHDDGVTALSDAGMPGGIAAGCADTASGILAVPMGGAPGDAPRNARGDAPGDAIVWFRPELPKTVRWAGDPRKPTTQEPNGAILVPRKSFAAWSELVRGQSEAWSTADRQAAEDLRRTVTRAMLQQTAMRLMHLEAFDQLTGLANRHTIEAYLKRWQVEAKLDSAVLLFIDLDHFETVNRTLGRGAGDDCLKELAARLRHLAPGGSVTGRLGGDAFVLFWPGASRHDAEALADALLDDLKHPFLLLGRAHYATASIGIACDGLAQADAMMSQAEAALKEATRQGGGRHVVFQPEVHAHLLDTIALEQDLLAAVENRQLAVHYQPIVSAQDKCICGFEALLRWHHSKRGWVPPGVFIPVAEDTGLIARAGLYVLNDAIKQVRRWRVIRPDLTVSVNISPLQLADDGLMRRLPDMLAAESVPPDAICLEVTEAVFMDARAMSQLCALRGLGVGIAVGDFGTGHTSLAYLQSLPATIVKIGRCFVAPLGTAAADQFFGVIVNLAHAVNFRTIAEGCETWEQFHAIAAGGCAAVQGWLVAPAMDAAAAERFLHQAPHWAVSRDAAGAAQPGVASDQQNAPGGQGPRVTLDDASPEVRDAFFAAVTLSAAPVLIADPRQPDMPIVFANDAFTRLTGYGHAETIGRNCRFLQGPDTDPGRVDVMRRAIAAQEEVTVELLNYRKDGSAFVNTVRLVPVFDRAGALVYYYSSQMEDRK
jgi:diguanylate cyclase (GGDEF)-like protein/PAS domain S-box-containing protein